LILFFSITSLGASDYEPIGYIEIDFGPIQEGRPVRETTDEDVDAPVTERPEQIEDEQPERAAPQEARAVDLPDVAQVEDVEKVTESQAEAISPEQQTSAEPVVDPEPQPNTRPRSAQDGGATGRETGAESGDDGSGNEAKASAPFQIEGLNRTPVTAPAPPYAEKVNVVLRVRITVDPQGRVVRMIPLLKGNPTLEQAVLETLRDWRFNPLPPNAPQENQTGIVTFRFTLE
jgi:protein TonB